MIVGLVIVSFLFVLGFLKWIFVMLVLVVLGCGLLMCWLFDSCCMLVWMFYCEVVDDGDVV